MSEIQSARRPARRTALAATLAGALALGGLLGPAGPAAAQGEPIRIGVIVSLSGPVAAIGAPERDAIQILTEQINAQGGVKGRQIALTVFDDGTNPTEAARGATQLIQQDKVVAIIGSTTGSATLALAPVAARYQVPVLAMVASVPVISKSNAFYPWVFRSFTDDTVTTRAMLQRLAATGVKRVGVYYQEDAYGKFTADFITSAAPQLGLEVVEKVASALNATDLTAQATKLRNANADAVVVQVSPPALAAGFSRAAKQVGLKAPLWGGIGFGQRAFVDALGKDGDGMRAMLLGNFDDPTPELKKLADMLRAKGKTPYGFTEVGATNALLHLTKALESDPAASGEKLRSALEKVCGLKTFANGSACFSPDDHNGWSVDLLVPAEIRNGKYVTLK